MPQSSVEILVFGASRGVALYAVLHLVKQHHKCTLLLRKPATLTETKEYQELTDDQKANIKVIQGDALNHADVDKAVQSVPNLQCVVSSLGAAPTLTLRGVTLDQPNMTTRAMAILLPILKKRQAPPPRLVVVTTMGLGSEAKDLPFLLSYLYPWLLHYPHIDKEGMEWLAKDAANLPQDGATVPEVVPKDYILEEGGWLKELIMVRCALMTDGAETGKFRAEAKVPSAWTISRRDCGLFVARECITSDKWVNKRPVIAY